MITYELAKKLKDAGFPQKGTWTWLKYSEEEKFEPVLNLIASEYYAYVDRITAEDDPDNISLSELIEACVALGRPIELVINPNMISSVKIVGRPQHYPGATPEIAVANLWLKLHAK